MKSNGPDGREAHLILYLNKFYQKLFCFCKLRFTLLLEWELPQEVLAGLYKVSCPETIWMNATFQALTQEKKPNTGEYSSCCFRKAHYILKSALSDLNNGTVRCMLKILTLGTYKYIPRLSFFTEILFCWGMHICNL